MMLRGKLTAWETTNSQRVFHSAAKMRGSEKAICQLSKPQVRSPTKKWTPVLKLRPTIKMTG